LLVPALSRARLQARTVVCQSNLHQWAMTLATYTEAHDGRFPSSSTTSSAVWLFRGTLVGDNDPDADHGALHGFQTRGMALCPMATRPADPNYGHFNISVTTPTMSWRMTGVIGTPSGAWQMLTPEPPFLGSYGYNQALFQSFRTDRIPGRASGRTPDLNIFSLREHASIPVLLDATGPMPELSEADMRGPGTFNTGNAAGSRLNAFLMDRHGRRATNGMFLDFSVRKVGLKELYTLKWASDFDRAGPWTRAGGVQPEDWPKWMRDCKVY
jgi:hypothetical protein